jgi:hypothetical protein
MVPGRQGAGEPVCRFAGNCGNTAKRLYEVQRIAKTGFLQMTFYVILFILEWSI